MVRAMRGNRLPSDCTIPDSPRVAIKDDASHIGDTRDCDRAPGLLGMRYIIRGNLE
jgi:hypothetical protein